MKNLVKHFVTITRHRHLVLKYCFKCGLYKQGLLHDLSKYSFVEFINGVRYFAGNHSPITNERKDKGYSDAWMHHKGRNKHHSEYWIDLNKATNKYEPIEMPDRYIGEMFCDRLAASKNYNRKNYNSNMPLEYLYRTKDSTPMHPNTFLKLESLIKMYIEVGEKETFKYIKKNMRKKYL